MWHYLQFATAYLTNVTLPETTFDFSSVPCT